METKIAEFLTPKQKCFCDEYLTDRNATAAALRAGYSKETALSGYLMTLPKIKLYIDERIGDIADEVNITHAQVLRELCKIAFGNMSNYFAADGCLKPMNALTEDDKAALWNMSITEGKNPVTKIKMYNKLAALEKIAKHINFYGEPDDEPKVVYKYVTTADITHDDTFDDSALQQEIMEIERKAKVEAEFEGRHEEKPEDGETESLEEMEEREEGELVADDIDTVLRLAEEAKAADSEIVSSPATGMRPNFESPGLSGRLISVQERAERKKEANYWIKQPELRC